VSFFEPLPPSPPDVRRPRRPRWAAPPVNELPSGVPAEVLLARSDEAAVALGGIRVFSTGFELSLWVVARGGVARDAFGPGRHGAGQRGVRFGLRCADGTRAEAERSGPHDGQERTLVSRGGGGDASSWHFTYWAWPLPPPGQIELFCCWEPAGIPETRSVLDAAPILEAAARVVSLWPEEDDAESTGGSWSQFGPRSGA
jgi:hypothetical protein